MTSALAEYVASVRANPDLFVMMCKAQGIVDAINALERERGERETDRETISAALLEVIPARLGGDL